MFTCEIASKNVRVCVQQLNGEQRRRSRKELKNGAPFTEMEFSLEACLELKGNLENVSTGVH